MRKVVNYLEPQGAVSSIFGKAHGANLLMSQMVDHGRQSCVDALVVTGHYQEIDFQQR